MSSEHASASDRRRVLVADAWSLVCYGVDGDRLCGVMVKKRSRYFETTRRRPSDAE